MSSRGQIAARQRDITYRPSNTIAPHVLAETQRIDSSESVLEICSLPGCREFWTSSKFVGRYYRVVLNEQGQWFCSATDERVARMCKAQVQAYLQEEIAQLLAANERVCDDPFVVHSGNVVERY